MPILNWLTRDDDIRAAQHVPYRLFEEVPELSAGDGNAGNMLIQGDNMEALKALLPFYAGRVKCIYIDPPYNTRSAFEHYDDNLEHTKWLAMMWPRLEMLRDLLAEDGLLFAQIDDNEGAYFTVILDEIFGRKNRVNTISVKMSESTGVKMSHAEKRLPKMKETILIYQRGQRPLFRPISIPAEKWNDEYKEIVLGVDQDNLEIVKSIMEKDVSEEAAVNEVNRRLSNASIMSLSKYFKENDINGKSQDEFKWKNAWRIVQAVGAGSIKERALTRRVFSQDISSLLSARGKLYIFKTEFDENSRDPRVRILFADKYLTYHPGDFWPDIKTTGGVGQEGGVDFPKGKKPERLIQRILGIHTSPGDLVLDSFLGSGTTAAVAHKMGRRYIGIEMGDHARTHCAPRLNNVVEGEQSGISKAENWQGGGGFRFYKLGPAVFDEEGHIRQTIRFPVLAAHVWFSETDRPWDGGSDSPLLGIRDGRAYALLYNGILGDKRPGGGNVLTRATLALIREDIAKLAPDFDGPLTVYGEQSRLTPATLDRERITFKQTPYDVKARA